MIQLTNSNDPATTTQPYVTGMSATMAVEPQLPSVSLSSRPIFSVEMCARIELSMVKEVEAVFIDRESDGEFRIITVVNDRDAAIRDRVYAREEEIMAAYPGVKFDFHVLARMNRKLEDVITRVGRLAFER